MSVTIYTKIHNYFRVFVFAWLVNCFYSSNVYSASLSAENVSGLEGSVVSVGINYDAGSPGNSSLRPVSIKFKIVFDSGFVEVGQPIEGPSLGVKHVQYSKPNNSAGYLDVIIVPAEKKISIDSGQILQVPFRLKSAGGQASGFQKEVPISFSDTDSTNEYQNYGVSTTNGIITINWLDSDNDGVPDYKDVFPNNPDETEDTDGDGIGNNTDGDDDNDGIPDQYEEDNGLNGLSREDADSDKDNDGLSNLYEYQIGTYANNADSDGDGMPDGWEVNNGLKPRVATDAADNPDDDGLTNLQEYQHHTDPHNPDSDGDGVLDGDEVAAGTDPLLNIPALMSIIQNLLLN
jgi:hypothetical protein